jgi:Holliday junction resolvase-like predicted endonuclease
VRTRTAREYQAPPPELSVTLEKQQAAARTVRRFPSERHVKDCPMRFEVVAIEEVPGRIAGRALA